MHGWHEAIDWTWNEAHAGDTWNQWRWVICMRAMNERMHRWNEWINWMNCHRNAWDEMIWDGMGCYRTNETNETNEAWKHMYETRWVRWGGCVIKTRTHQRGCGGNNTRESQRECEFWVPTLQYRSDNADSIPVPYKTPAKCQEFFRKSKDSGAQAGVRKFSFCETEPSKA